ncbi:hypothetical protein A2686_01795 [Candidatus Woesebacteria bacterium RIFCSPHIGHO2_01_FULL_38_10]|uniref:Uncharacterized protein n=1 Tax=Candidatus Woesebacteria bacterium RIFCSPLOWO2_01_FULL_39_10b TaxID=1802517 RepID=A0A1F8B7W3_9BACT|nr:MAG: hypothetical protein A2686_01795 [Candidatus Woesebacteria bacterium RIFCSPHIGHO2_01_FULL_38_10]OGM59515.1 MAG: hypothetical protein A2892_02675 [Candidatus Woesebacteria bacterium RIFCSPLOWO2_01_FULL_39_10b]
MANPDITPGGGATLKVIRLIKGEEREFTTRPAGYLVDENSKYIPLNQRPTEVVKIRPMHPVYTDPVTGEEKVGNISL